jgi:hypothetical protein
MWSFYILFLFTGIAKQFKGWCLTITGKVNAPCEFVQLSRDRFFTGFGHFFLGCSSNQYSSAWYQQTERFRAITFRNQNERQAVLNCVISTAPTTRRCYRPQSLCHSLKRIWSPPPLWYRKCCVRTSCNNLDEQHREAWGVAGQYLALFLIPVIRYTVPSQNHNEAEIRGKRKIHVRCTC